LLKEHTKDPTQNPRNDPLMMKQPWTASRAANVDATMKGTVMSKNWQAEIASIERAEEDIIIKNFFGLEKWPFNQMRQTTQHRASPLTHFFSRPPRRKFNK
jgi:hypothetical protein